MEVNSEKVKTKYLYEDQCFPHHRIIAVKELLDSIQINREIYLGRYEVEYYQFLEKHRDKAFTFWTLIHECAEDEEINPLPPDTTLLDYDSIDDMLRQMVAEGKICGAYFEGNYFYYYPPK